MTFYWTAKGVLIAVLLTMLAVAGITLLNGGTTADVVFGLILVAGFALVIAVRLFLGTIIATAAMRRNCGYNGWRVASLIIGPLIVWIFYLVSVHWRYAGEPSDSPADEETETV